MIFLYWYGVILGFLTGIAFSAVCWHAFRWWKDRQ